MSLSLKTHHLNKLSLKICSLILGYSLWNVVSKPYKTYANVPIPVSFYNTPATKQIEAPESITIQMYGQRDLLFNTAQSAAVHCDAQKLREGKNSIAITDAQIFLPQGVTLVHCIPSTINVTVT